MILSGGGAGSYKLRTGFGGGHVNSVLIWGGHMNSARAWPPFSGPPQHFSNEHSLRLEAQEVISWIYYRATIWTIYVFTMAKNMYVYT